MPSIGPEQFPLDRCAMWVGFGPRQGTVLTTMLLVLVAFSSFAVAAYTSDSPLTSDKIFPAISLYMLLQFPLAMVDQSFA